MFQAWFFDRAGDRQKKGAGEPAPFFGTSAKCRGNPTLERLSLLTRGLLLCRLLTRGLLLCRLLLCRLLTRGLLLCRLLTRGLLLCRLLLCRHSVSPLLGLGYHWTDLRAQPYLYRYTVYERAFSLLINKTYESEESSKRARHIQG